MVSKQRNGITSHHSAIETFKPIEILSQVVEMIVEVRLELRLSDFKQMAVTMVMFSKLPLLFKETLLVFPTMFAFIAYR